MRRVAVTGGIAEGKSTVIGYLRAAGHEVASADEEARAVFESAAIQRWLGDSLGLEQPVARAAVRAHVLANAIFRRALNARMHPAILDRLLGGGARFLEIPLLFEGCLQGLFERVWVVTCGPEEQLRRLELRLGDRNSAVEMLGVQLPTRVKCALADRIVRTNAPEHAVQRESVEAASDDVG